MPGGDLETAKAVHTSGPSTLARWCRSRVLARLGALDGGRLVIRDADGEHVMPQRAFLHVAHRLAVPDAVAGLFQRVEP
jgi:hypothetical protein